ncbi:MAG: helix-turn-helix transcriptional regulator [Firmicutes bacterium]|nr:helix-turn-helix transcriptional regulator [Bacillota bacterium]
MNQEKIGQYIKDIRKKRELTQEAFAQKLGVTYQAVSKWETGKSIPDITTLKLISETFKVNIEDLLEGEEKNKNNKQRMFWWIIPVVILLITLIVGVVLYINKNHHDFEFKKISTTCKDFTINGSAAYNRDKTSIYISNINYCGKEDNMIYKTIECSLYENYEDTITLVSKCTDGGKNITLEDFLEDVEINVDNYSATCKKFQDSYLYLEISATQDDNKNTTYKIPITLKDNC